MPIASLRGPYAYALAGAAQLIPAEVTATLRHARAEAAGRDGGCGRMGVLSTELAARAETFHWTSPAKEACVVETDRQIDLCSEHAKRPASVPGLWRCKDPIVGIGSGGRWWKSPVTDLPVRRGDLTPWRRQSR